MRIISEIPLLCARAHTHTHTYTQLSNFTLFYYLIYLKKGTKYNRFFYGRFRAISESATLYFGNRKNFRVPRICSRSNLTLSRGAPRIVLHYRVRRFRQITLCCSRSPSCGSSIVTRPFYGRPARYRPLLSILYRGMSRIYSPILIPLIHT